MELHTELLINTTLKPLDAFIFKYRTQDISTAEEKVPGEYHKYLDVFKEEVEWFPDSRLWDHAIKTKPGFEPRFFKLYNLRLKECKQQELFIKENLKKVYIRLSSSPMASLSSLLTRKMENYNQHRIINTSISGQSRMPICYHSFWRLWTRSKLLEPSISPNLMFDGDSTMYTSKIVTNGKWHSRPTLDYTNQLSCSLDYAIPLQHSKQWWMTLSKTKLKKGFASYIYMDNILIFTKNKEDLKWFTKHVLESLWKADLYLKSLKCEFCKTKIEYLGLIIEEGKMMMDPIKLTRICDWPISKSVKQVHSFLGFGNFDQCFIQKFSKFAQPMNKLLQKDQSFIGTMLPNKKWINASLKNQSLWCSIKPNLSKLNVMHQNMHLAQSLHNLTSMVINTHVPSYHGPFP